MYRSLLFIPGDSDKKIGKAASAGADLVIFDLEDSVAPGARPEARIRVRDYLEAAKERSFAHYVRINPLDTEDATADLDAVMAGRPDGVVLPKAVAPSSVQVLTQRLNLAEKKHAIAEGSTKILAIATETPGALFSMGAYADVAERLMGLTWGAEDLAAAIGALSNKGDAEEWSSPFMLARSLCLFAAANAGVAAVDSIYADFRNADGLAASAACARIDGFTGKLAIHPAQIETINKAFTPSAEEIDEAREIIALFDANPDAGALSYKGRMVDMPHLVQAKKVLALAGKR